MQKPKIIRITTIPGSMGGLLQGQLKYMSKDFEIIGISSYDNGILDKVALKEGIRVIPIEMTRKITPFKDLRAVIKLYRVIRKERPQIVHSHTPKAGTLGMFAAKLAGVPHRLHTIAGLPLLESTGLKRKLLNLVERITYACATKIYPNSNGLQKIILENKFTHTNKLKVIGNGSSNGIDTSIFNPLLYDLNFKTALKRKLKIHEGEYIFIYVGRLVKDKGINELIAAYSDLGKHLKTKLILVGPYERELDPLKKETEDCINKCENIIAVGYQNDVRPFFAIADCLVFPSYREGFPNVVMQAGSMGLKSIVTNINGCNEIIKNNVNGNIIPVKNVFQLKKTMIMTIENAGNEKPNLYREIIAQKYERKFVWEQLHKEYKSFGF